MKDCSVLFIRVYVMLNACGILYAYCMVHPTYHGTNLMDQLFLDKNNNVLR